MATESGVVRFDGVSFSTYNTANTAGLKDNFISALMMDRTQTLWAGTWVGGVIRISNGKPSAAPGAEGSWMHKLFQDRAGRIWGARETGLTLWTDGRFRSVAGIDTRINDIAEAADGTMLLATEHGINALTRGRVSRWQPAGGRIDEVVSCLYSDRDGGVWVGTTVALYHATNGRLRRYVKSDGLPDGGVSAILRTRNGQLWIGTDGGGIARLERDRLQSFTTKDGLTDDAVRALFEDREGSLWVGTRLGGVNRFREPILTIYTTHQGLSSNSVWSIDEGAQQNLLIGNGEGVDSFRDGKLTPFVITGHSAYTTLLTTNGDMWIATHPGLNRLHGGHTDVLAPPFPQKHVAALFEDRDSALWIGGYDGLARWKAGVLHDFTLESGVAHAQVTTIMQDRDGTLWIGTHGNGLLRMRNGTFTAFTTKQGLTSDVIEALYLDDHGIWIGTQRGLNLLHDGQVIALPLGSDAMSDIYKILKDDVGNFWMSSNEGLARVSEQGLRDVAAGRRSTVDVKQIVPLDGRGHIEFNGGSQSAGWKSADGRLWFASVKGLVMVDPAHITSNPLPPPVHIERLLVDGRSVDMADDVQLPPSGGGLEVHYTATSLQIPARVAFRYKLEGYDEAWIDAGHRRVAYYTHVPGGHYRFRVVAANNDGVWNETGATLSFGLGLHLYETRWFYALCAISALASLVGIYRLRVRRMHQLADTLRGLVDERTSALQEEVTERRSAEERYRHLFDANPQPVWVNDRDTLAFLAVNDAATRHYGYSREEFFAMRITDLQPVNEGPALVEWLRAAGDGSGGTSTWQNQKKDGSAIEVEVAAKTFTFMGRPAILIVAADVTARRTLEERLRQSQKMEAVGQLAGGIAHDLNNVLTAVMAHVDLAVTTLAKDDAVYEDLTQAQGAAHRGAAMIRKLLGFSRRERLALKPLRLEALIDDLAVTLRRMLPESIDIVVTKEDELPPVAADGGAVQQILLNLANNARDAMPLGGRLKIDVRLATPSDELMAAQPWGVEGYYVVLSVSDDGGGMDGQTLSRIFEPYFSTKPAEQGSGLGMAMVFGLMKQHLGYVLVDSKPGIGTDVRLYFPTTAEAIPVVVALPGEKPARISQTILVVEDQEAVRGAAIRVLTRFGYQVLSAGDGEVGLQMWRENSESIDLVVSDAIMPRMGGMALFEAMSQECPDIRFLLTSGYTGVEVKSSMSSHADLPFLPKPWTVNELLTAVRAVLNAA
ncbi:MAG: two-component regulator propeller domain-containing protein [bacterium]